MRRCFASSSKLEVTVSLEATATPSEASSHDPSLFNLTVTYKGNHRAVIWVYIKRAGARIDAGLTIKAKKLYLE